MLIFKQLLINDTQTLDLNILSIGNCKIRELDTKEYFESAKSIANLIFKYVYELSPNLNWNDATKEKKDEFKKQTMGIGIINHNQHIKKYDLDLLITDKQIKQTSLPKIINSINELKILFLNNERSMCIYKNFLIDIRYNKRQFVDTWIPKLKDKEHKIEILIPTFQKYTEYAGESDDYKIDDIPVNILDSVTKITPLEIPKISEIEIKTGLEDRELFISSQLSPTSPTRYVTPSSPKWKPPPSPKIQVVKLKKKCVSCKQLFSKKNFPENSNKCNSCVNLSKNEEKQSLTPKIAPPPLLKEEEPPPLSLKKEEKVITIKNKKVNLFPNNEKNNRKLFNEIWIFLQQNPESSEKDILKEFFDRYNTSYKIMNPSESNIKFTGSKHLKFITTNAIKIFKKKLQEAVGEEKKVECHYPGKSKCNKMKRAEVNELARSCGIDPKQYKRKGELCEAIKNVVKPIAKSLKFNFKEINSDYEMDDDDESIYDSDDESVYDSDEDTDDETDEEMEQKWNEMVNNLNSMSESEEENKNPKVISGNMDINYDSSDNESINLINDYSDLSDMNEEELNELNIPDSSESDADMKEVIKLED